MLFCYQHHHSFGVGDLGYILSLNLCITKYAPEVVTQWIMKLAKNGVKSSNRSSGGTTILVIIGIGIMNYSMNLSIMIFNVIPFNYLFFKVVI